MGAFVRFFFTIETQLLWPLLWFDRQINEALVGKSDAEEKEGEKGKRGSTRTVKKRGAHTTVV